MTAPKRLKVFPRDRLVETELLRCRASELDLLGALGEPTSQTDPQEPDPVFYWDLEWACGLVTSVAFHQVTEVLTLHLDRPEVDHAVRHLGIDAFDTWLWQDTDPEGFARAVPDPPDRSWSVWRAGDAGRRTCLASGITERDARCWADELAAAAPADADGSVRVWAERLKRFPDAAPLPSRSAGP